MNGLGGVPREREGGFCLASHTPSQEMWKTESDAKGECGDGSQPEGHVKSRFLNTFVADLITPKNPIMSSLGKSKPKALRARESGPVWLWIRGH